MCGIRTPSRGVIRWNGDPVTTPRIWTDLRRTSIGIVFQDFNLFPTLTAGENVEIAMFGTGSESRARRDAVEIALGAVGVSPRTPPLPPPLSGGGGPRAAFR